LPLIYKGLQIKWKKTLNKSENIFLIPKKVLSLEGGKQTTTLRQTIMKLTNLDFLNYVQELSKSELKGLNFKLELNPMPLTYSINGDSYIKYLHEIKRNGKTLLINSTIEGPYIDEDGFLENENKVFTFKNDRYSLKGYNFGGLNFNELKEHRVREY